MSQTLHGATENVPAPQSDAPTFANGQNKLLKVQRRHLAPSAVADQFGYGAVSSLVMRHFTLQLVLYIYNYHTDTFQQLPAMPIGIPAQVSDASQALNFIDQGAEWSVLMTPATRQRLQMQRLYGMNDMSHGQPSLLAMVAAALAYPTHVVQFYELLYLLVDGFYVLATALLLITILSAFVATKAMYDKRVELFREVSQQRLIPLLYNGRVRAASSRQLIPGDIVVVLPGKALCDMVLLQGNCLVEESNLSGEAAQVRKSSYVRGKGPARDSYHPDTHHTCTVYAGTTIHQVWANGSGEEEVLGMVVRTGLRTTMGSMLRQIIAPDQHSAWSHDPFLSDLGQFYAFCLVVHLCIFLASALWHHNINGYTSRSTLSRVVNTFIAAAPIGCPTVVAFANAACVMKLRKAGVHVLSRAKLRAAAAVTTVCFDKTGTLTGSVPELHGMIPVDNGMLTTAQRTAVLWPARVKQAVAVCNSLNLIAKNKVVGDLADQQGFRSVEAQFLERDVVTLPRRHSSRVMALRMLKRFEFEGALMRSGAIVVDRDRPYSKPWLFVRGAPGRIRGLIRESALPGNFHEVLLDYASQSFRLMAIAAGPLKTVNAANVADMDLLQAERCCGPMELLGLLVLSNKLHPASEPTIRALQERGGIRTVMVTGDYHHTAIAVARAVGMVPRQRPMLIIEAPSEMGGKSPSRRSHLAAQAQAKLPFAPDAALQSSCTGSPDSSFISSHASLIGSAQGSVNGSSFSIGHRHSSMTGTRHSLATGHKHSSGSPTCIVVSADAHMASTGNKVAFADDSAVPPSCSDKLQDRMQTHQSVRSHPVQLAADAWTIKGARSVSSSYESASVVMPPDAEDPQTLDIDILQSSHLFGQDDVNGADLVFTLEAEGQSQQLSHVDALTRIAQGSAGCCITGLAFEQLLQSGDQSLVHMIISSVSVFARMRSQQKALVMDLLGQKGVYQHAPNAIQGWRHIPGLQTSCMYCGDGMNDLLALTAADVGMAVGHTHASAAAAICDVHPSVQGVVRVLREARSAQAIKLSAIKYMVGYTVLFAVCANILFFSCGATFSVLQRSCVEAVALSIGIVVSLRPAAPHLNAFWPQPYLFTLHNCTTVAINSLVLLMAIFLARLFLEHQVWYPGSSSSNVENAMVTMMFVGVLNGTLLPIVNFSVDTYRFCKLPSWTEIALFTSYGVFCIMSCLLGPDWFDKFNIFHFYSIPFSFSWRLYVMGFGCMVVYWSVTCIGVLSNLRHGRKVRPTLAVKLSV